MGFFETFTRRMKRGEKKPDVFEYDQLPTPFRRQVCLIVNEVLGPYLDTRIFDMPSEHARTWDAIKMSICKEHGVFELGPGAQSDEQVLNYILGSETNNALDAIDIVFTSIQNLAQHRNHPRYSEGINELNHRFLEHNLGYQFSNGQLNRIDSQFVHKEVVLPALTLIRAKGFEGAEEEFLKAHKHYRAGNYKETMNEALKAFESVMKALCKLRKIPVDEKSTAKPLLDVLLKAGLIPPEQESHFTGFRSAMESGLPTFRNRNSGHGQGAEVKGVPAHFAAHALHLAASNIVFLIEAHKASK